MDNQRIYLRLLISKMLFFCARLGQSVHTKKKQLHDCNTHLSCHELFILSQLQFKDPIKCKLQSENKDVFV